MANIFEYDVQRMNELVRACRTANSQLDEAEALLLQVKSHKDWTCREKTEIDEQMGRIKKLVNESSDMQNSFFNAVSMVADKLNDAEKGINNMFTSVEDELSSVLAVPTAHAVVVSGNSILDRIKNTLQHDAMIQTAQKQVSAVAQTVRDIVKGKASMGVSGSLGSFSVSNTGITGRIGSLPSITIKNPFANNDSNSIKVSPIKMCEFPNLISSFKG